MNVKYRKWSTSKTQYLFNPIDFTITITDDAKDKVVAVGTIFIERKFIRKNGLVGHIEDIAVDKNQQGKKLGLRIIQALKYIGAKNGCYKVILDCSEKVNVGFIFVVHYSNVPQLECTLLRKVWI